MSRQFSVLLFTSVFMGARRSGEEPVLADCTECDFSTHMKNELLILSEYFDAFEAKNCGRKIPPDATISEKCH